jgi:hypothetical protein
MEQQMDKQGSIIKIAFIRKVKGKGWCVFGHKKTKKGKRRRFGCYKSKKAAKKRLGQIYFFRGRGALDTFVQIADDLDGRGMLHLADAVMDCLEHVVAASLGEAEEEHPASVKLGKVAAVLERKGEHELAEKIDSVLPDVLDIEAGASPCPDCPDDEITVLSTRCQTQRCVPADRLYKMAKKCQQMYAEGLVDETSFEYKKYREFRYMLRTGFLLPPPDGKDIPKDADNWWDHFEKEAGR